MNGFEAQALGRLAKLGCVGMLGAFAFGCTETPPPAAPEPCNQQVVTLNIYAADLINPNDKDNTRPVVVRLYQLGTDMVMANARYDDILLKDVETLGADMLGKNEVTVFPNDLVQVQFERNPEASFLAGTAMFHGPQGNSWKTFYEFPPMPNTPAACAATGEENPQEPQAFPKTNFFVVERKIDNGGQYDPSMFPDSTPIKKINLPKSSAAKK